MAQKDIIFLALIALLAVAAYAGSLNGEFIYDDHVFILDNEQVAGDDSVFGAPTPSDRPVMGLYRPLVVLSYRLNRLGAGFLPAAFHGTNIVLHLLTAVALYFLVRSVAGSREGAFLGGMLFAVHPVHAEAVAWIVGRAEIMAALFCLLAALAHRAARRNGWFHLLAAMAFMAACLSKENAFAFPLILVVMDALEVPQGGGGTGERGLSRRFRPAGYGLYALVLAGVIAVRFLVLGAFGPSGGPTPYGDLTLWERIPVAFSILAESLRLLVIPIGMRIFYHASEFRDVTVLRIAMVVLLAAVILIMARRRSRAVLWVLWIPLSLVTVLNLVPIGAPFAERFLYLPSAGACAAAGLGLAYICGWAAPGRGFRSAVWAPAVLVLVLGCMTWLRNPVYHDAISLWEDAVTKADYPYTHYNLGESYFEKGHVDYMSPDRPGALAELHKSLEMNPEHPYAFAAHFTLGRYYLEEPRRDYRRAAHHLRQTVAEPERLAEFPRIAEAYATLAEIALATRGRIVEVDEALAYCRFLRELDFMPDDVKALEARLEELRD